MREAEFEEKVNTKIYNQFINNNNIINNEYFWFENRLLEEFYNDIENFTDEEKEKYNIFICSLKNLYLKIYAPVRIMNDNIKRNANFLLDLGTSLESCEKSFYENVKYRNKIENDILLDDHKKILDNIKFKFNEYSSLLKKEMLNIVNSDEFLEFHYSRTDFLRLLDNNCLSSNKIVLSNMNIDTLYLYLDNKHFGILKYISDDLFNKISNEKIKEYLKMDNNYKFIDIIKNIGKSKDVLENMDVDALYKYLDNKRYDILEYIPDSLFKQISEDKLKYYLSTNEAKYFINTKERIQYLISRFDFRELIDSFNSDLYLGPIYREITFISEEDLDYIITNKKYNGIEECKYIISNINYVKKLIDVHYTAIFNFLSLDQIDDEILKCIIYYGDENFNINNGNLKYLLKDKRIFSTFSRSIVNYDLLLGTVGYEDITDDMISFCLLDGMKTEKITDNNIKNRINKFISQNRSYIKYALECGYKCSNRTIELTEEEIKLFIDNGQTEIINYQKDLSMDIIKYAISKGYIFNNKILDNVKNDKLDYTYNLNINTINELVNYAKNNKEFCDSILINLITAQILPECVSLLELYKDNLSFQSYLKDFDFFSRLFIELEIKLNSLDELNNYFNESGVKNKFALLVLLNNNTRKEICNTSNIYYNLTPKEQSYFRFLENVNFSNDINFNLFEIKNFFDKDKINDKGIEYIINNCDILDISNDNKDFKEYYLKNYNLFIFDDILEKTDFNYYYLIKFFNHTLNLEIPLQESDIKDIKEIYCLDILNINKLFEIIKYTFFAYGNLREILSNIIYEKKFKIFLKQFLLLSPNQDIKIFNKMLFNYCNFKSLYINLYDEKDFTEYERTIIYNILVNGDICALDRIKNREDIQNYSKIKYDKNNEIINMSRINSIKNLIFSNIFNMWDNDIDTLLKKYNKDVNFSILKDNIHNDDFKKILDEYDAIIEFISSIYNSDDLESLKIIANKINDNYKNNSIDIFFEFWNTFSEMNSDIMKICGSEINEKITIFNELLNTYEEDIPLIDGEKAFIISSVKVKNDFMYDNITINKDTNVQMIELNGLPFLSLGHVLNAYGHGGKLSNYNHPKIMGSSHLCLSGIDDNYYKLVEREDCGIDYVQLLFDNLPSESLVIASSSDVNSHTGGNDLYVSSSLPGSYEPIRTIINNTYHDSGGYNEYVYYRQYSENMQSLRPSAILIRSENPTESEIKAAAYLNVPLVKINKEKYPIRTKEEMQKRDIELKDFYQELYKSRKSKLVRDNLISLQNLKQQIMNYYVDDNELGRRVI